MGVVIGTRQVLLWLRRKWQEGWTALQESRSKLAREAQTWLRSTGWQNHQNSWNHPTLQKQLCTEPAAGQQWDATVAKRTAHLCREGWRTQQWKAFLQSGRRESRAIVEWQYQEQRFGFVRTLAQGTEGAALAILYGSSVSPACFALRRDVEDEHGRCPYCRQASADHAHIFWQCPERPPDLQRYSAQDAAQARLGWPLGPDDPTGIAVLRQMTSILEDVWRARHSFQPRNAESYQSARQYTPKGFTMQLQPTARRRHRQVQQDQHEQS